MCSRCLGENAEKNLQLNDPAYQWVCKVFGIQRPKASYVLVGRGYTPILTWFLFNPVHEDFDSAIVDYTEAIRLNSDYTEAYAHRRVAKAELGNIDEARSDLQTTLELAERQGNPDFKAFVEKWLQRLDQVDLKQGNHKQPRRGGQWKGKVKIAEDFDELPESFMAFFQGEEE